MSHHTMAQIKGMSRQELLEKAKEFPGEFQTFTDTTRLRAKVIAAEAARTELVVIGLERLIKRFAVVNEWDDLLAAVHGTLHEDELAAWHGHYHAHSPAEHCPAL